MNSPDITATVLAEHRHDLHREASSALLASVVRCCRPSTWVGLARRARATLARDSRDAAVCSC
ncbi:MAG: hypothetical protein M0Z98_01200 [Actinomycetales bacterium]|nr:hypothetical protein [Actinomycetales bacterium]